MCYKIAIYIIILIFIVKKFLFVSLLQLVLPFLTQSIVDVGIKNKPSYMSN